MLVYEALDRFLLQLEADGRSPHTVAQYRRHVRLFAGWLPTIDHSGEIEDVDDQVVARFLASPTARETEGRAKKPGSTNALRTSLRLLFRYLHEAGLIPVNPARLVRRAVCAPPPPRALRPAEQEELLGVLGEAEGFEAERDRVLVQVLLATGVRLSSALALDVEDVDLEEGALLLRRVKGSRTERVLLGDGIRAVLAGFLGGRTSGPVFASRDGRRIGARHAQRRFRAWREKAGIPSSATPHSCRHAFAMHLYEKTGDLLLVGRALGHRSITSTLTYARASESRLRAVLANA